MSGYPNPWRLMEGGIPKENMEALTPLPISLGQLFMHIFCNILFTN
jgi:hypothetical protein